MREALAASPWLPDHMRPKVVAPPPAVEVIPASTLEQAQNWIVRHKILSGVFVLAVSYATYRTVRSSKLRRKTRRARRARNGSRLEVVVIAGSPTLPLTKALALDLERKGFIVFIVCNSIEDDMMVQNMSRPDIKPLGIDITDVSISHFLLESIARKFLLHYFILTSTLQPPSAGASIERFAAYLQTPHAAVPRAKANYLTLKSVLLIPSLSYQTSPIATIPPSSFADLFNTHLLHPILTIQSFLPLLTSRLTPPQQPHQPPTHHNNHAHAHPHHPHKNHDHDSDENTSTTPKVVVFTPSIISSINPPFHAPEATICSALSAFTEVLTAELSPLAIPVTHVQLGTFDFSPFSSSASASHPSSAHGGRPTIAAATGGLPTGAGGNLPPMASHPLQWPEAARHAYARNFAAQSASAISAGRVRGLRGSSLRDLHNAVFDVLDGSEGGAVVRVGLGAGLYGFVGRWMPRGLVAWMMGIRKVDGELSAWNGGRRPKAPRGIGGGDAIGSGSGGSDAGSSSLHDGASDVSSGEHQELMKEGSEFISVGREDDHHSNVWKD